MLYRTPEPAPVEPPDCDPLPDAKIESIVETAAKAQKLPPKLLRSVVAQESGFRPCAVSKKGAQGLMQLMPCDRRGARRRRPVRTGGEPRRRREVPAAAHRQVQGRPGARPRRLQRRTGDCRCGARAFPISRRRATTSRRSSTRSGSNELTRRVSRRPSPLKIEAAEPAGHIHHLADEVQPGGLLRLHRLGG